MNTVTIAEDVKLKLEVDTRDMVDRANSLEITSEQTNTQAATFTAALKQEIKARKVLLAPSKAALDAQKAAYNGLVGTMITPLDNCVTIITQKIGGFVQAENARRAELQRIEDERVAAAQRKEEERQAKAAEKGRVAPPKLIMPARTVAAVAAPVGTSYVTRWSARVDDIKALCRAVADGLEPENLIMANMPALNARAIARKAAGDVAPGVSAVSTVSTQQR